MILALRFARFLARFLPIGDRRRSGLLFHSLFQLYWRHRTEDGGKKQRENAGGGFRFCEPCQRKWR